MSQRLGKLITLHRNPTIEGGFFAGFNQNSKNGPDIITAEVV